MTVIQKLMFQKQLRQTQSERIEAHVFFVVMILAAFYIGFIVGRG